MFDNLNFSKRNLKLSLWVAICFGALAILLLIISSFWAYNKMEKMEKRMRYLNYDIQELSKEFSKLEENLLFQVDALNLSSTDTNELKNQIDQIWSEFQLLKNDIDDIERKLIFHKHP